MTERNVEEPENTPAGEILAPMVEGDDDARERPPVAPPSAPKRDEPINVPDDVDTENSPAGQILRPMMPLAEERRRDLETVKRVEEERRR
ncbi:MAG TPA: hypothetical protein VHC63_09045 [Acidimicrobiales bacterium]|nr:hypothetical protein [Acidimicrobiales bacterium]